MIANAPTIFIEKKPKSLSGLFYTRQCFMLPSIHTHYGNHRLVSTTATARHSNAVPKTLRVHDDVFPIHHLLLTVGRRIPSGPKDTLFHRSLTRRTYFWAQITFPVILQSICYHKHEQLVQSKRKLTTVDVPFRFNLESVSSARRRHPVLRLWNWYTTREWF